MVIEVGRCICCNYFRLFGFIRLWFNVNYRFRLVFMMFEIDVFGIGLMWGMVIKGSIGCLCGEC